MAHLYRLIAGLLLLLLASTASALIPANAYMWGYGSNGGANGTYPASGFIFYSKEESCTAELAKFTNMAQYPNAALSSAVLESDGMSAKCYYVNTASGPGPTFLRYAYKSGALGCPANSTAVTGGCTCTSPYVENAAHTACEAPPDPCLALAGKETGLKVWNGTASSFTFCDGWNPVGGGKCIVTAVKDLSWQTSPTSGVWLSQGIGAYTGASAVSCNGDGGTGTTPAPSTPTPDGNPPQQPAPGEAAPSPCPVGQAPGTINGTAVCAPRGSDIPVESTDSKRVTNPDGSTTNTDGTTKCQNGKCTTNSTVCNTPVGGTATCQTTTTTEAQAGFCDANKGSKVCQGTGDDTPSSFGGTCAAGFKATGDDAVLNAMALEQYKRNCETFRTDQEPSTWVTTEGTKTTNVMTDSPNNAEFTIGASSFDTSDALGGGSCSLNKTVTVRGMTATLPFNVLCDPLAIFGQILVACALLLAARIVTRG